MNYYKHYKNKPYAYVGEARHSETLEEMVIYETRYANENGKVWVRPKTMFFEDVVVSGVQQPRFAKVPLTIQEFQTVSEREIQTIGLLMQGAFGEWDPSWFLNKFKSQSRNFLLIAIVDEKPVAFKLGFELSSSEFYSWLGGVLPDYRGLGIAQDLMKRQHEWCLKKDYQVVKTKSQNRFKEMILLNLRCGFEICGFENSGPEGPKILFSKKL